jgi:hypothetical protein
MNRSVQSVLVSFVLCGSLFAATDPSSWVRRFSDDFEDGTTRRWNFSVTAPSTFRVERDGDNPVLVLRGETNAMARTTHASDYRFKARLKLFRGSAVIGLRDSCERYVVDVALGKITLQRSTPCGSPMTVLDAVNQSLEAGRWYVLEVEIAGNEIRVSVDGEPRLIFTDNEESVLFGGLSLGSVGETIAQVDDVEVSGPPVNPEELQIVDLLLPPAVKSVTYEHRMTASGGTPPYLWSLPRATLCPKELSLSPEGLLKGTVSSTGWFYPTMLSVTDAAGNRAIETFGFSTESYQLTTPRVLPAAEAGKQYQMKLEATGAGACSWVALDLPPGLVLNAQTGMLSGVPALGGTYRFLATCLGPQMEGPSTTFALHVQQPQPPPLTILTRPEELGDLSIVDSPPFTHIRVSGGVPPYSFAVTEGELPPGTHMMTGIPVSDIDPLSLAIGGTPWSTGEHSFTLEVTDSAGSKATQQFTLRSSLLHMEGSGDEVGMLGAPFSRRLRATNAIGQTRWTPVLLPAGLELTPEGELKGTPTECGLLRFIAEVKDSGNPPMSFRSDNEDEGMPFLCRMDPLLQLDISIPQSVRAKVGEPFLLRFGVGNGTGAGYRVAIDSGRLAPGLSMAASGSAGVYVVSGAPSEKGVFDCFLRATDSGGNFGLRRLRLIVE